jgi:hypothetical protein
MNREELAAAFRKLGAPDPDGWARSQLEEGIPQLARFLFLRQAWRHIVEEGNSNWIDAAVERAKTHPNEPYAGVGHVLKTLRARGATDDEITDVVRGMQAQLLFSFCYLLEDPGDIEPEAEDVGWALVQVDAEGNTLGTIGALHESVLETDPTGREMRPKQQSAG